MIDYTNKIKIVFVHSYRRVWGDLKRKGFILSEQSISGGRLWLLLGRSVTQNVI